MGIRIIDGHEEGDTRIQIACLFDSVSDWTFGPVIYQTDHYSALDTASAFLRWLNLTNQPDARTIDANELEKLWVRFCTIWNPDGGIPQSDEDVEMYDRLCERF